MKILHAISSTAPSGGGPIEVIRQAQPFLEQMGHGCEIVCADRPDMPWLAASAIKTHALGPGCTRYQFTSRLVPWLQARVNEYDCVVVLGLWRYVGAGVWRALRVSQKPYFLYAHGMLDPVFRRVFPWKHWQKWIYWRLIERRVVRDARAVLFTCREEARKAADSFRPYQATAAVVPCCVAPPPQERREATDAFLTRWPETRDKRVLLFLGRLHRKKGCDVLIEGFSRFAHHDAKLHFVMAGPAEQLDWVDQLKRRARVLGIEPRITWPGMLSGDLKWAAFRIAEAFVLPSHQENFGIAVVEALACGTPVLISRQVDIWPEIVEAEAGFVDEVGLAGTLGLLKRWFALAADSRDAMHRNAKACFRGRFQGGTAAARLIEVLKAGIARPNISP